MKKIVYSAIPIVLLLLLWFIVTETNDIPNVILPSPGSVVRQFAELSTNGYGTEKVSLIIHLSASLKRLVIAFIFSVLLAVPLGLVCGYFPAASSFFSPLVEFYRPIPPLAYYTLLVLWMGIAEGSKIMLLFLAGFAPVFISCVSGVKKIPIDYLNASYMLGASKIQTFKNVILPAALPDIFTGIRTALGVEYTTLVAAEMVAAKRGIGWMVLDASNWLKSDVVFAGVILMGLTGVGLNAIILFLENRIVHWTGK